jgi:hypothetical protein
MKTAHEIINGLAHCTGSQEWHRWSVLFRHHVLTDGVKYLCDSADCYWLVDAIASYTAEHQNEEFQCWNLEVKDGKAILEGHGGAWRETQEIGYTDFPLPDIKLYCNLGSLDGVNPVWVIMLPSEN